MKTTQKKLERSQIEVEFELTAEEFERHFEHALEHLKSYVKVDGFRPGQAPKKLVEEKLKPEALLMEAGDHAVQHVYPKYVKENNLEPIGQPEVKILKIAKGNPFIFIATITVLPEIELPDYKEIAKIAKGKEISVTEEEVQDSINYLQKTRAKFTLKNEGAEKKDFVEIKYQNKEISEGKDVDDKFILSEGGFMTGFEDAIVGMKAGEEKEFSVPIAKQSRILDKIGIKFHEGMELGFKVKMVSVQKMELPEINDEFAKQLGAFDTLVSLRQNLKEGITMEKTEAEKQRKRAEILEKIAEKTRVELPDVMVEYEKQRLLEDLKNKIEKMLKGQSFSAQGGPASGWEEYLATIKKTEEEIKETYQKEAEKRLRVFLVLRELGKKENIEVLDKEVEEEVSKSIKNYSKEHDPKGTPKIDINQLKEYTKTVILNEKIFKLLECQ